MAVEEQFYLLYALMILVIRKVPKVTIPLVVIAGLSSFVLAWVLRGMSPTTAFYMLPARAWQLAIGVLVALSTSRVGERSRGYMLGTGVGLMAWAAIGFDEHAKFPGPQSVAACFGTAMALLSVTARGADAWWGVRLLGAPRPTHLWRLS